jgi:hypothetical protein
MLLFPILDTLLHRLAWTECHNAFLSHVNRLARARTPCLAGCSPLDLANPEVAQLNTSFHRDRIQDRIQNRLHGNLYQLLVDIQTLGNGADKDPLLSHRDSSDLRVRTAAGPIWPPTNYCFGRDSQWLILGWPVERRCRMAGTGSQSTAEPERIAPAVWRRLSPDAATSKARFSRPGARFYMVAPSRCNRARRGNGEAGSVNPVRPT